MSESILNRIVSNDSKNQKEMAKQTSLLSEILSVEKDKLKLAQAEAKQAARDRQKNKRTGGDRSPGAAVRRSTEKDNKDKKKGANIFSQIGNLLKGLGGLKGVLKLMAGSLGLKALTKALERFTWANFLKDAAGKISNWIFGKDGFFAKVFGKNGALSKAFGKDSKLSKAFAKDGAFSKAFGKNGSIAKAFGKNGAFAKAFSKKGLANIFGKGGIGKLKDGMNALFGAKGLGGLFGKKGIGGLLGKVNPGKMIKGGGIIAALTSGIQEYFDTGSYTEGLFSGGGAGAGALAGGALGSFLGPVGTIVGGALGAFIGEKLGDILKEQLDKVPFLQDLFSYIDKQFESFIKDIQNYFAAIKDTFGDMIYMFEQFGRAFNRFNTEVIQPFFKSIGDFIKGVWESFTSAISSVVGIIGDFVKGTWETFTSAISSVSSFLQKTFEPVLEGIMKFLSPILDFLKPLTDLIKELAMKVLQPVIDAFKNVLGYLEPILEPLKELANNIITPLKDAFKSILDFLNPIKAATKLVEGTGNIFRSIGDFFKNYADGGEGYQQGGFVGQVPHQGANGDRFGAMLAPGSVVLNQTAAGMMQNGGMVPTMLEQGEMVFGPGSKNAGAALMLNSMIPRFQEGGEVKDATVKPGSQDGASSKTTKAGQETLDKLNKNKGARMVSAPPGYCVTGSLDTMQANNVGNPAATGQDVGNNPRGMAAQLINSFGWGAAYGSNLTLNSPYGAAASKELTGAQYSKHVSEGAIPSGALVFQTRHDSWNGTSHNSRGYDAAIAQNKGANLWNGQDHGSMVYGNTKKVMVLTPGGEASEGAPGIASGASDGNKGFTAQQIKDGLGPLAKVFAEFGSVFSGSNLLGDALGGMNSSDSSGAVSPGAGGAGATSVNDPNAKALLNAIADAEGTSKYGNQGYNTQFTGKQFSGTNHPREVIKSGGYGSDAAGRYQFLSTTWDEYSNGRDMSAANQDQVALDLVSKKRGVNIKDGLSKKEIYKLGQEWASIEGGPNGTPGGSYGGQAKYSAEKFMAMYKGYGGKIEGMQNGGVANMRGSSSQSSAMVSKSQQAFAEQIAAATTPVVIPMPTGGGGGGESRGSGAGPSTTFPVLSAEDSSIVSMEYKYRITMGASV